MARLISIDDSGSPEGVMINSFAVFMGCPLMGVRELGLLVLAYMDHRCPPWGLRLRSIKQGLLVSHGYHASPNCRNTGLFDQKKPSIVFSRAIVQIEESQIIRQIFLLLLGRSSASSLLCYPSKERMVRLISIDDSRWYEVSVINSYAVFMAYLLMGVRGLGLLMLTWTTVVLLGGFVSNLSQKDFWSLAVITLVQAAGVFDFILKEKLGDVVRWASGFMVAFCGTFVVPTTEPVMDQPIQPRPRGLCQIILGIVIFVLLVVNVLACAILFCPLALLYVLGLYICVVISLWRLIAHDYGNAVDGNSNMRPALTVLYSLAVAQGMLFGYRSGYALRARKVMARKLDVLYKLGLNTVLVYLDETVKGCEKDPSFARGRNLLTYAVDLLSKKYPVNLMMEPQPCHSYLDGVRILGSLVRKYSSRRILAKQLLTESASFVSIVGELLETMGPRSPWSMEIREHAARILTLVAGTIHLDQFPGGIHCVSSLLDTFEEYHSLQSERYERNIDLPKEIERDWLLDEDERDCLLEGGQIAGSTVNTSPESDTDLLLGHTRLVVQGLRILQNLAADEDNCRVISNTEGLLLKIMAPLISDSDLLLHRDHHDEWCSMAEESMELMSRLMATPGETGTKMLNEISSNIEAIISTLQSILECHICEVTLKRQTVEILLDLSVDTSSIMASESSKRTFMCMLIRILLFKDDYSGRMCRCIHWVKKRSYIRRLAAEKLQAMQLLRIERSATSMLPSVGAVLGDLTRTLLDAENNANRVHAAQFLEHLCRHYPKDDECLKELKKAMVDVMPKLLKEMLDYGSTREEIQIVIEGNNVEPSEPSTDSKNGGVSQGNGREDTSSSHQQNGDQHEGIKLLEAQYNLWRAILWEWIDWDTDVTRQLNEIAEKVCSEQEKPVKNFKGLVIEAEKLLKKHKAEELARVRAAGSSRET
ncbi:hypothetical protein ACP70R_045560 [Stipagrostis hirtigluma subsp. patula]